MSLEPAYVRKYEKWVSWSELEKIEVPQDRIFTERSIEEEECMREAMSRDLKSFFELSPIIVTESIETGKMYLADGYTRMKIAKELKIENVKLESYVYEKDRDAYEAAIDFSSRKNLQGKINEVSLLRTVRGKLERGFKPKEIADRLSRSENYIYKLIAVLRDAELTRLVEERRISIYEATEAAYNQEKKRELFIRLGLLSKEPSLEYIQVEAEKPRIEEISAGEARTEEIEARWKPLEEISKKEPRFEEIYERAVRGAEAELRTKISGTIKYGVKRIAEDLNIRDEEDIKSLLKRAEEILGDEKSDIQQKVLWAWKKGAEGKDIRWGLFTFKETVSRILEEVKKGKYAEAKPTVSTYRSVAEARPRVEEKAKKTAREPLEPKHKVEEAVEVKPAEASLESLEEEFKKLIERAKKEAVFILWASFGGPSVGSLKEHWYVVNDERLYDMYREAGELGTRMVFEKSIENIRKILVGKKGGKDWSTLYKAFDDPKVRDEAVKVILETYRECRDEIIMMRDKLRGEVWDALVRTLRDATPFPIGDGRALLLTDTLDLIIAKRRENEGYIRIEGKDGRLLGYKRLSEVLATLTKENTRIVHSYEMPLARKVKRLVISPKSFPGVEDPGKIEIVVPQCLNCGGIMRDGFTDLPHVCSECNSPAKEHRLYEGKPP